MPRATTGTVTPAVEPDRRVPAAESTAPRIINRLAVLRAAGRRRRWRVQGVPIALGSLAGLIGFALFVYEFLRAKSAFTGRTNASFGGLICAHLGPFSAALALRPQDGTLLLALLATLAIVYFGGGFGGVVPFVVKPMRANDVALQLMWVRHALGMIGGLCASAASAMTLYSCARLGTSMRVAHRRMWLTAGWLNAFLTFAYGAYVVIAAAYPRPGLVERSHLPVLLVLTALTACISALSFWEPLQERVHAWLAQRGESVSVAAGISELLCGRSPEEAVADARESFRAVPLDRLRREHLRQYTSADAEPPVESTDDTRDVESYLSSRVCDSDATVDSARRSAIPPPMGALRPTAGARASSVSRRAVGAMFDACFANECVRASLGSVDAFISHSWHDDADLKWEALQAWRRAFVAAHGREPTVWFDGLCIVQKPELIARQLASLPVYLAGCRTLLVLRGASYTTRLWCLLELFIFSEMGAGPDQIHVARLADRDTALGRGARSGWSGSTPAGLRGAAAPMESRMSLAGFDVRNAMTSDPRDRQALLAVIENAGAGADAFNAWARPMLARGPNPPPPSPTPFLPPPP